MGAILILINILGFGSATPVVVDRYDSMDACRAAVAAAEYTRSGSDWQAADGLFVCVPVGK